MDVSTKSSSNILDDDSLGTEEKLVVSGKPATPNILNDDSLDTEKSLILSADLNDSDDSDDSDKESLSVVENYFDEYKKGFNKNYSEINDIENGRSVNICCYKINESGKYPFLEYLLFKYPESKTNKEISNLLVFPSIKYNKEKNEINKQCDKYISKILKKDLETVGYIKYNGKYNFFYEITDIVENIDEKRKEDQWWWVLIDEIANHKKILNFKIFDYVHKLFINNKQILILKNIKDKSIYITPKVLYHGTEYSLKDQIVTYGLNRSKLYAMMGYYYYFGSFIKSVRYAGWTSTYKERKIDGKIVTDKEGRYKRGAILRYAVFTNNTKVFLNHPLDKDDYSELVKKRISKNVGAKTREELLIKMHDHNGEWAKKYDSAYVGSARLSNGTRFMENYEYIIKSKDQFQCLTTQELDRKTLNRDWKNNKDDYNIL